MPLDKHLAVVVRRPAFLGSIGLKQLERQFLTDYHPQGTKTADRNTSRLPMSTSSRLGEMAVLLMIEKQTESNKWRKYRNMS